jgi:DNA/RNA-binding domain of Phe-tRNA-synthetase-like protein
MADLRSPPFEVRSELDGWTLFWADLELTGEAEDRLAPLLEEVSGGLREEFEISTLSTHPTVAALRKLFRAAGCDPTRYRPSSEALLRRVLKGGAPPPIHPLVDLNNCLSLRLAVPCCVTAEGVIEPPLVFRAGREGESYESLRGPFNLAAKPLLADDGGPLDAPITGSQRGKVRPETKAAWLTAYLPAGAVSAQTALDELEALLVAAPVARLRSAAAS